MERELTKKQIDQMARELARRVMSKPPRPRTKPNTVKPDRERASKLEKRGQAGEAS